MNPGTADRIEVVVDQTANEVVTVNGQRPTRILTCQVDQLPDGWWVARCEALALHAVGEVPLEAAARLVYLVGLSRRN